MTNNIQITQIELIEKKFNVKYLILSLLLIGLSCYLFIYSSTFESIMLSSAMIFVGITMTVFAIFLIIAKLNNEVYVKTNSPIIKRQLYFDSADFYNLKDAIDNADYNSIEKFKRVEEGNVQLYVIHSKDKKFAAMQLLKYEPFDFVPQTEMKVQEF